MGAFLQKSNEIGGMIMTDEKKELKVGDTIKIENESIRKHIKNRFDELDSIQCGIYQAMKDSLEKGRDLWEFINETHPETENFHCGYDRENNVILITKRIED